MPTATDDVTMVRVAVFGLGEAGSLIAGDLAAAGAGVRGYDPAAVPTPAGVERAPRPTAAVRDADVVLAVVPAADAVTAAEQALDDIPDGAVYADLGTGPADLKRRLAAIVEPRLRFVDVGMMTTVPGHGVAVPSLASGTGADDYVALLTPLGAVVDAIGPDPGTAATRKLLRSIVMKGLAGLVIEAMRGAHAAGEAEWVWRNVVEQLTVTDEAFVRRLVDGTGVHHVRRHHEMEASQALLEALGVDPVMTRATVAHLARAATDGVPPLPEARP